MCSVAQALAVVARAGAINVACRQAFCIASRTSTTTTIAMSALEAAHSLLNVPGKPDALHRVKNEPGYHTPTFAAKDEQRAKVQALIASKGFIPHELAANEVAWFYDVSFGCSPHRTSC